MGQVVFTSMAMKLGMALIAVLMVWAVLRFLDYLSGFKFGGWLNETENDLAVAVYLGARVIGACILVGYLFS